MMRASDSFITKLLRIPFSSPQADLIALCDIWMEVTQCDWVWLWIHNAYSGRWELRMHRSKSTDFLPLKFSDDSARSVAEYSADTGEVIFLNEEEFEGWERTRVVNGKEIVYRCLSAPCLQEYKCKSFTCIPISAPAINDGENKNPHGLDLSACLCIHYLDGSVRSIGADDLKRLGELTNFFISNSYRSRNERTLHSLYKIDSEFAFSETKSPRIILQEYSSRLLRLLCGVLRSESASLFFDLDGTGDRVNFVASTLDIMDWSSRKIVTGRDLKKVGYKKGEGQTGSTFASGCLSVLQPEQDANRNPMYVEARDKQPLMGRVTAFIPLKLATSINGQESFKTVGVLRCAGATDNRDLQCSTDTFDQIDLVALQFFCEQIAPVIQTLIGRIEREKAISIVKHDLVSPISHIRHIADDLETIQEVSVIESLESIAEGKKRTYRMKIPFRDLMNIKAFAIEATNLIYQLDPDLSQITRFAAEDTYLEGHIIARLKRAMQYQAWAEKRMKISFHGLDDIPALKVDRGAVERVFFNLISNAIKYGEHGSQIFIRAFEKECYYCVAISNYGKGIEPVDRDLIFEEEYRSTVALESQIPGLGLGLYIARKAMEKHGGKLELTSLANPTTFCASFPTSLRSTGTERKL